MELSVELRAFAEMLGKKLGRYTEAAAYEISDVAELKLAAMLGKDVKDHQFREIWDRVFDLACDAMPDRPQADLLDGYIPSEDDLQGIPFRPVAIQVIDSREQEIAWVVVQSRTHAEACRRIDAMKIAGAHGYAFTGDTETGGGKISFPLPRAPDELALLDECHKTWGAEAAQQLAAMSMAAVGVPLPAAAIAEPNPDAELLAAWDGMIQTRREIDARTDVCPQDELEPFYQRQNACWDVLEAGQPQTTQGYAAVLSFLAVSVIGTWNVEQALYAGAPVTPKLEAEIDAVEGGRLLWRMTVDARRRSGLLPAINA